MCQLKLRLYVGTVTTPNLKSNPARAICSQPVSKSDSVNVTVRVEKLGWIQKRKFPRLWDVQTPPIRATIR